MNEKTLLRIKLFANSELEQLENHVNKFSELVSECEGYITMVQYQTIIEPFQNNINRGGIKYSVLIGYECDRNVNNLY